MNILINYIFTAMVSWVPIASHSSFEPRQETEARYMDIAETITEVALDPNTKPLFEDEQGRIKTALVLVSVASSESHFKSSVDACKVGGDHGRAWGLWQTHSTKEVVCADRNTAAKVALRMMRYSFKHCARYNLMDRLAIYTGGKCKANSKASRYKMVRADNFYNKTIKDSGIKDSDLMEGNVL